MTNHFEYGNIERLHELTSQIKPLENKHHSSLMILCLISTVGLALTLALYNPTVFAGLGEIEKATMLFKQF